MATAARKLTFTFDERTLRYRGPRGTFVSQSTVRTELAKVTAEGIRRAEEIGKMLQAGSISTAQFQIEMRDLVKALHSVSGATARGGWAQMSQGDWGKVGSITREQYEFLNRLGRQIEDGLPLNGAFMRRVKMYADASRATYENFNLHLQSRIGKTEAMRVQSSKEGCSGCDAEAAKGWVAIDAAKPLGNDPCLTNCLCIITYK